MLIKNIDKKKSKLIIFNNNTPFIRNLYKDFNYDIISSYNPISHRYKEELVIYN